MANRNDETLRVNGVSKQALLCSVHVCMYRCCHVTDIGVGYLSTMTSLCRLYLRWCTLLRDFGLQHLYTMKNLTALSLAGKSPDNSRFTAFFVLRSDVCRTGSANRFSNFLTQKFERYVFVPSKSETWNPASSLLPTNPAVSVHLIKGWPCYLTGPEDPVMCKPSVSNLLFCDLSVLFAMCRLDVSRWTTLRAETYRQDGNFEYFFSKLFHL